MKIETFIKGSVVVVVMFILGLTLLGEGILQQKYSVTDPPTFGNVTNYQDDLTGLQTNLEEETLARSEDPGRWIEMKIQQTSRGIPIQGDL